MDFDASAAVAAIAGVTAAIALLGGAKLLPSIAVSGWRMLTGAAKGS